MPARRKETSPESEAQSVTPGAVSTQTQTEPTEVSESSQDESIDGILVAPYVNDGKLDVRIQVLGNTRITEAETILGLGLKSIRRNLDLP